MSILATAKNKAASANVKDAFKNEAGAIDLASIMVGIIVIGLIGGVIAATVFAVIPWAQDNAAKQQLDSVVAAQSAYIGLSADDGNGTVGNIKFGSATDLTTKALFDASAAKVSIATNGQGDAAHYGAAISSSSGKVYYVTDKKTQPTGVPASATAAATAKSAVVAVTGTGTTWTNTTTGGTGPIAP